MWHKDVVIVGGGVTGLAAAWHLAGMGCHSLVVVDPGDGETLSSQAAGMVMGGQFDNFSRVAHAHGQNFGAALWRFGDEAYDHLREHCRAHKIPFAEGGRLRLITSPDEEVEARVAVQALQAAGIPQELCGSAALDGQFPGLGKRVQGVQNEGQRGGWVDSLALITHLRRWLGDKWMARRVMSLSTQPDAISLRLDDGQEARAQMVILANHLGIGRLRPFYKEVLISIADQWSEWRLTGASPAWWRPGMVLSAHHGYEWGVVDAAGALRWGGARFLRKWAGIEAEQASVEPRCEAYLQANIRELFPGVSSATVVRTQAGLDLRPCDELPVIGPDFQDHRLLVASGYMGTGLTLGFYAGLCLAEIVMRGVSPRLPERLHPRRLRSIRG